MRDRDGLKEPHKTTHVAVAQGERPPAKGALDKKVAPSSNGFALEMHANADETDEQFKRA